MTTAADTIEKRSVGFLFRMCSLILGANLVWISYNTILLSTLVEKIVPQYKGLVVGMLAFLGTLIGLVASIMWGIISDHTNSHLGKRSPSILTGSLLALPLIGLPALLLAPSLHTLLVPIALPIVVISFFGMQFSTNMSNGAWWPLLVDIVPENQRGLASGIQGFLTLVGSAIGVLVVTSLNQNGHTAAALWLIAGIFTLSGLVNVWAIRGKDEPAEAVEHVNVWNALTDMFKVHKRIEVFFWLVLALLFANMGINSLMFFQRYFFQVYFPEISPDAAYRAMGGISLVVTMLSAIGAGFLSDKIGRRALILWGILACSIITLMMGFTTSFGLFLVLATLRAVAMGPILATAPALASDLSPKEEAGQYMAYNNLSTGLAVAITGLLFGFLLINMTRLSFSYIFIISAILIAAGGYVFSTRVSEEELEAGFAALENEAREVP